MSKHSLYLVDTKQCKLVMAESDETKHDANLVVLD